MKFIATLSLLAFGLLAHAQERVVTGQIVDKTTLLPIANANILIQGTTSGTISNLRGFFQINLKANYKGLIVSHVSYQEITIVIPEVNSFKIEMEQIFIILPKVVLSTRPPELAPYQLPADIITYKEVEQNATFNGGTEYLISYLTSNFNYPDSLTYILKGSTYVSFNVEITGAIGNILIHHGSLNKLLKNQLILLFDAMPDWQPAYQNGAPVSQQFVIPIDYGPVSQYAGDTYLNYYLQKNITYPPAALRLASEGTVFAYFSLNAYQEFTRLIILQGIGDGCDKMVYDAIKGIPKAELMKLMAGVGDSVFVLPVDFRLDQSSTREDELVKSTDAVFLSPMVVLASPETKYPGSGYSNFFKPTSLFYSVEGALKHIENATELRIVNQQITVLSAEIKKLTNLQILNLQKNELRSLPDELIDLPRLTEFYAPQNKLSALPLGFSQLEQLKVIGLAHNEFTDFPMTILRLKRLRALDLSNNNLSEIPVGISNLKRLKVLILNDNNLQNLPDEIFKLNLLEISLQGNNLSEEVISKVHKSFKNAKITL